MSKGRFDWFVDFLELTESITRICQIAPEPRASRGYSGNLLAAFIMNYDKISVSDKERIEWARVFFKKFDVPLVQAEYRSYRRDYRIRNNSEESQITILVWFTIY